MKYFIFLLFASLSFPAISLGQTIYKPKGCSASTGPNVSPIVLQHSQDRYNLITIEWSKIEPSPGVFSFSALQSQINTVKSYNKKYALAIISGGTGTPDWLIDDFDVPYIDYLFRGTTPYRLPLWWNQVVQQRMASMIMALGLEFGSDTSLALVYVTQMTANGIEGHLNGIDMNLMRQNGFSDSSWVAAAKQTCYFYAQAFNDKAIAFEVHNIDDSEIIPSRILNDLYLDSSLCRRIGAAIWWLSGKTSYQPELLNSLQNFKGDKYAQIIGKSDDTHRFEKDSIASAFEQAKQLGVRYIEPWFYEYQNNTIDSLLLDFNDFADNNFNSYDTCQTQVTGVVSQPKDASFSIYPNPASSSLTISTSNQKTKIEIYNSYGSLVKELEIEQFILVDILDLPNGFYMIRQKHTPRRTISFIKE